MESKERIAYLKGLLDGLRPQDETQVKVYAAIVDALEALADEVEMHSDELHEQAEMVEELNEFCESLEDDMEEIEKIVSDLGGELDEEESEEDEEDFETVYQSAVCPKCGHHHRINARQRLDLLLDPEGRYEIGAEVVPVDSLKFKDSKRYPDRLAAATDELRLAHAIAVRVEQHDGLFRHDA